MVKFHFLIFSFYLMSSIGYGETLTNNTLCNQAIDPQVGFVGPSVILDKDFTNAYSVKVVFDYAGRFAEVLFINGDSPEPYFPPIPIDSSLSKDQSTTYNYTVYSSYNNEGDEILFQSPRLQSNKRALCLSNSSVGSPFLVKIKAPSFEELKVSGSRIRLKVDYQKGDEVLQQDVIFTNGQEPRRNEFYTIAEKSKQVKFIFHFKYKDLMGSEKETSITKLFDRSNFTNLLEIILTPNDLMGIE